ncbi:hypothetical protein SARC_10484 [Sphaeroforma arctica JP610]|uniref:Asn/Gln amidotransferase domain-containing protein n=1 Tax=Sphaeroforma arctica JP610 TaxID=667725 RepID=A0A0L0FJT9_9EUKA|nr:hypothetical protein SARC_10484 [Sphaeroforma arctica JP610]KNC77042.1 hypothetical protein SARC_10484 [Sphaeroforma arctica JP610]|eukprot:XP_014150944.1 hypothetical protein SARC_10484 [Sphaeroforma arctica JP610]
MYSPKENVTLPMRSKEIAKDYRFMPEPDVPSLVLTPAYVESIRSSLPTLSTDLASYMSAKYGLNPSHGEIISADAEVLECYESLVRQGSRRDSSAVGKWMCSEILSALNNKKTSFDKLASPYDSLSALYDLVQQNTISTQVSRKVFALICDGDIRTPQQIIKANDWATVSDVSAIRDLCAGVIAKNQDIVTVYKLGKQHVFKALIGKAMKEARGKADAKVVTAQLQSLLDAENK